MKTHRVLVVAMLAGVLVFTSVKRANAVDGSYQDLLSNMLYGLVLGTPYGGDPYAPSPYEPYGYDPGPSRGGYYEPSRGYYDPYPPSPYDGYRDRDYRYDPRERLDQLGGKYGKAMSRLDQQEREAREKAYRKYHGDVSHPKYREQMAKIGRKYGHKREKVERNTAKEYRKFSDRFAEDYDRPRRPWW